MDWLLPNQIVWILGGLALRYLEESLEASVCLSVFLIFFTLGHLDYVLALTFFRINLGTLDFWESHKTH